MAKFFDEHVAKPIVARLPKWIKANHLSFVRVALAVPIILWLDHPRVALCLLIVSSLLDIFDGPVARLRKEKSDFGALLDTFGDKVVILGILLFLGLIHRVSLTITLTVVGLDIGLAIMRVIEMQLKRPVDSNAWGAIKMWVQSIALGMVVSRFAWAEPLAPYVFYAAIACAILSLATHIRDCFGHGPSTA